MKAYRNLMLDFDTHREQICIPTGWLVVAAVLVAALGWWAMP